MTKLNRKILAISITLGIIFGLVIVTQTNALNDLGPAKNADGSVPDGVKDGITPTKGADGPVPDLLPITLNKYKVGVL